MHLRWSVVLSSLALLFTTGAWAQIDPGDTGQSWQLHIDVSTNVIDASHNAGLTVGVNPAASDGWDADFDLQGPGRPPSNYASLTLRHITTDPGWEGKGGVYVQDVRSPLGPGESHLWDRVVVETDLGSELTPAQVELRWAGLEAVPADIQLNFNDPNDVNGDGLTSYDIRATNGFTFVTYATPFEPVVYSSFSITATNTHELQKPTLSAIQVGNLTATGFDLSFTTDVATGVVVDYGIAPDALTSSTALTEATTSHTVTLNGLTPNTPYYYRVTTRQEGYGDAVSEVVPQTTLRQIVPVGQISVNATETSAVLSFATAEMTSATIDYGTTSDALTRSVSAPEPATEQSITLSDLLPGQQYFYRITRSAEGYEPLVSEVLTFSTAGSFVLNTPVVSDLAGTHATVTVNTGIASTATLRYGTADLSQTMTSGTAATTHAFNLTGLNPGQTYQFQVTAEAVGFSPQTSVIATFTTLNVFPGTLAPAATDITGNRATVGLTTQVPVTAVIEYGTNEAFDRSLSINTETTTPSFALTNLQPNTQYQYRLRLSAPGYETVTLAAATFETTQGYAFGNGDVSGDGVTNVADAIMAARAVVGLITLTPEQISRADVRAPEMVIDIGDVVWILKIAVGLVPPLPG